MCYERKKKAEYHKMMLEKKKKERNNSANPFRKTEQERLLPSAYNNLKISIYNNIQVIYVASPPP